MTSTANATVTNIGPSAIFRLSAVTTRQRAAVVALVTVTITGAGAIVVSGPTRTEITAARCPHCRTLIMAIPGPARHIEVRAIPRGADWGTCQGRVVRCPGRSGMRGIKSRCDTLVEIVEHDPA